MTPEERLEAIVEILARGLLRLLEAFRAEPDSLVPDGEQYPVHVLSILDFQGFQF